MLPRMSHLLRAICPTILCLLAALPAQEGGKRKPGDKPKQEAGEQHGKDKKGGTISDPVTDKDPAVVAIDEFIKRNKADKKSPDWRLRLSAPPIAQFDKDSEYLWHIDTTQGLVVVRFFPDTAPMHVTNGIFLARLGFYDGVKFHRIIKNFMAQGGCPLGTGTGGPGYKFDGEFFGTRKHDKPGLLSMANAGAGTDGSQFFLTFVPTPWLDGKHTIWGEVVDGMNVLKELEKLGKGRGTPRAEPPMMTRTWIQVKKKGGAKGTGKDDAKEAGKDGDKGDTEGKEDQPE